MASVSAALPTRLRGSRPGFLGACLVAPAVLAAGHALPDEGLGLLLRLFGAVACLLVVPGAIVLRALAWPAVPALALTASLALSLAIAFVAFAVTFALGLSLNATIALIAAAAVAGAVPALGTPVERAARSEVVAGAGAALAGLVFGAVVWWAADRLGTGDVLFHLARARKLEEADALSSVDVANEFRDGGLHPGYAFPLWHGLVAATARVAGVDVTAVVLHVPTVLSPIAFVVAYAAGRAAFGSWAGGVGVLAAQVAQLGFSRSGTGSFDSLAGPSPITRVVLVPALLTLVFAFLRGSGRRLVIPLAAASLAVAVVHPTYVIFAALALAGFAALRVAIGPDRRAQAGRLGIAFAAVVVPAGLFFLWLLPVVTSTASYQPAAGEEARALRHYGGQLEVVGDAYRAAPEAITRAGPVVVAGLAAIPLVALAARRVWAAFAVGGTLVVLALLLVPELFVRLSDLVSISQSRRLAQFLPIPFAVAGAAVVLGRLKLAGVVAALAAGLALEIAYTAESTHEVVRGGPSWPLWVAGLGGVVGLVAAFLLRRRVPRFDATPWAAAAVLAFVAPVGVAGLADLEPANPDDPHGLTPGLVAELRALDRDDVVFAPVETSYRIAAFAPVFVAATPPEHVGDTEENRPYRRQRDVIRFFAPRSGLTTEERRRLLDAYAADWLVVDKRRAYPHAVVGGLERAYEDARYALLRVTAR
jgi:hypothetical protein